MIIFKGITWSSIRNDKFDHANSCGETKMFIKYNIIIELSVKKSCVNHVRGLKVIKIQT